MDIEEIKQFVEKHNMAEIIKYCNGLAHDLTESNVQELANFLKVRHDVWIRYVIIEHISQLLILVGRPGIQALEDLIKSNTPEVREAAILEQLFQASKGKLIKQWNKSGNDVPTEISVSDEVSQLAYKSFVHIVMASLDDPSLFLDFCQFIFVHSSRSFRDDKVDTTIFEIISKSVIKINESLLNEYGSKILLELTEESFQNFFECNPCLIDPLASSIFNKTKLGDDLITDFVIRRLDNIYILVEIEKPNTAFLGANRPASRSKSATVSEQIGHPGLAAKSRRVPEYWV